MLEECISKTVEVRWAGMQPYTSPLGLGLQPSMEQAATERVRTGRLACLKLMKLSSEPYVFIVPACGEVWRDQKKVAAEGCIYFMARHRPVPRLLRTPSCSKRAHGEDALNDVSCIPLPDRMLP